MKPSLRVLLGLLIVAAGPVLPAVLPEDRADVLYHRYEGGGVTVDGPSILVRKKLGESVSVSANYYVDRVSSASIDVVIQAARLRDGSRRITHITEVMGMEGDTIITQDLFIYDLMGEDANGHIIGRHRSTGIGRPRFWDRARYYGEEKRLAAALDAAEVTKEA